jgi:hypothetical protein
VPAHLLTREAFQLYMEKIAPEGVLLVHISNRMVELEGPVTDIVSSLGWSAKARLYIAPPELVASRIANSTHVMAVARTPEALEAFDEASGWREPHAAGRRPWTDDRNNIPGAMWAKRFGW